MSMLKLRPAVQDHGVWVLPGCCCCLMHCTHSIWLAHIFQWADGIWILPHTQIVPELKECIHVLMKSSGYQTNAHATQNIPQSYFDE